MQLSLDAARLKYKSVSQQLRVASEEWAEKNTFCPTCKQLLIRAKNNSKVLDFTCNNCILPFELKSKKGRLDTTVPDGAFRTILEKVTTDTHPNFFLLSYGADFVVENLILVPKRFIVTEMIQERKPLGPNARRAGWVGCNLRFSLVPADGMIYYIKSRKIVDQTTVCSQWARTKFLERCDWKQRGWLVAVMNCVRSLRSDTFKLPQLYECERELQTLFPNNRHIKAKIRQQMQVLRDEGWLSFLGHGTYHLEQ